MMQQKDKNSNQQQNQQQTSNILVDKIPEASEGEGTYNTVYDKPNHIGNEDSYESG